MTSRFYLLAQALNFLRSRLSRRIALLVSLSIILVEAAILVPSYLNLRSALYEAMEQDVLTTARFTLVSSDERSPVQLLEESWQDFQNVGVAGIALYDGAGLPLAAKGDPVVLVPDSTVRQGEAQAGPEPATTFRRLREASGIYAVLWPGKASGLPFVMSVRLDTTAIDGELKAFVLRIGGLVLLLACFVSVTTILILGREVLTPLLAIHRNLTAAHADPGRADAYKLDIRPCDEIGETVTALNVLLDRVADLRRSDLRNEEQRFEDFAKSSSDWFWEMDEKLRFSFFSERFAEVTGVDERELLGKTRQETGIPGVALEVWEQHLADLAAQRPFRNFTHPREKADGQIVWLAISGTPAFDADGVFLGYRGTGRDITAEIELQEKLRSAKDLAETANRTKSEFLANMSHELRTPLNAIIGFSELMLTTIPENPDNEQYREYLTDIHEAAHHLLSLINDILDLSKIEAGADELNEEVVDVATLAQAVLRVISARADKAGVALRFEPAADLPQLFADERKLKQALLNLLTNAVKFTERDGSITLKVWCRRDTGYVLQVIDSGIGMAAEDIPKALRQFGQVDSNLNRRYEGTGLGLPLTKALIEMHQGVLNVQSEEGAGTIVTLRLPAHRIVEDDEDRTPPLGDDTPKAAAE
ncbi:PAS domain S-box protein [Pelagibius litoralis]|uniref:histidine kinase n=1 Tax=Pelagibius litoralis TaxID=374515 RepID=A0A967EWX2_9PROT|nr:PAS domain-containing sensor histidine kinase [Pelagibius litoralis]NIA68808.1 PAS domain S-box protein [Pelagibius litoralis]